MALDENGKAIDRQVFCPIFDREIPDGLCWEIANIGNDSLKLPPDETPPCGWDEARRYCNSCPEYAAMSE